MARHRSNRALHNDAAIRGAAVDLVLKVGIDAISFRDVGRAAKLSHGALYARFEDVEELLVDLWDHVLVGRAISLFEQVRLAASTPTKKNVDALIKRLRHSTPEDVTMVIGRAKFEHTHAAALGQLQIDAIEEDAGSKP